jgi:hypothetical protein
MGLSDHLLSGICRLLFFHILIFFSRTNGPNGLGWLNELGSWITEQLMQAYHQYGVGLRPAL